MVVREVAKETDWELILKDPSNADKVVWQHPTNVNFLSAFYQKLTLSGFPADLC